MSKKSFLIPTALAVVGLLAATQANATLQPIAAASLTSQSSATAMAGSLAQNPLNGLTVNNASNGTSAPRQFAEHYSHSSHASHASHYSSR